MRIYIDNEILYNKVKQLLLKIIFIGVPVLKLINILRMYKGPRYLKKWIYNYSVVVVGIMIITMLFGQLTVNITRQEINDANNRFIMQSKTFYDWQFKEIESYAYELLTSLPAQNIINRKSYTSQEKAEWIKYLISNTDIIANKNEIISNVYMLFYDEGICVGGGSMFNNKILYETFFSDYYKSPEECVNDLKIENYKEYKNISDDNGDRKFLYIMKAFQNQPLTVVVEFNQNAIVKRFEQENYGDLFLLDKDKNIIFSNTANMPVSFENILNGTDEAVKNHDSKGYVLGYINSDILPGTYLHIVEKTVLYNAMVTTNMILTIGYLFCFIISLILIIYMTIRNYSPIEKLLNKVEMDSKNIRNQENNLKEIILSSFILGKLPYDAKDFSRLSVELKGDGIILILFEITDYGIYQEDSDCNKIVSFNISNVLSELVFDVAGTKYCNIDDSIVCLLTLHDKDIDTQYVLEKLIYARDFLNKHFGLDFSFHISEIIENHDNIPLVYQTLLRKRDNLPTPSQEDVIRCEKIKQYVEENFANGNLAITDIADYFGLSANYISKNFKTQTDEGLAHYIVKRRIEEVKRLLENTNDNLNQIAEKTGFYSSSALIRTFKKVTEVTPGQYRDNLKG